MFIGSCLCGTQSHIIYDTLKNLVISPSRKTMANKIHKKGKIKYTYNVEADRKFSVTVSIRVLDILTKVPSSVTLGSKVRPEYTLER